MPVLRLNKRLAEGFDQRTLKKSAPSKADIWIQAASAGEAYLAEAIINKFKHDRPVKVLLTSGTRQGVDILQRSINAVPRENNIIGHASFYPFDQPAVMEKAVKNINPKVMILLESEMWPGHLHALKKYGCQTIIINGRMTGRSLKRYLLWKSFWNSIKPDMIYAISKEDADRFGKLFGSEMVKVMPNIKFDRFGNNDTESGFQNPLEKIIARDTPFIVLGSVREKEEHLVEKIILDILKRKPETVIGLFPRHMHRIKHWSDALDRMNIKWALRTNTAERAVKGSVILWDTFGELVHAYKYAGAAFVGGSLAPLGGQNFLEALTCGITPVIGPSWDNFSWVGREIADEGLLRVAKDRQDASDALVEIMENPPSREKIISAAGKY
ncbi:MAG: glycosyltransferase N-terminal domain-containing protein, partial [Sulfurimicrobium sp.]|nr:glycosyltransferase N-terminal domain-containing protein [Sulfurimicrobium sp.]